MQISIGIFAHNEEQSIGKMLQSLACQQLLREYECEILVLENGSKDTTAEVAESVLKDVTPTGTCYTVHQLPYPGKARTWNEFVHRLSCPTSEYLIFLDADISFVGEQVLSRVVAHLRQNKHADVCVDTALKTTAVTGCSDLKDSVSLAVSELSQHGPVAIAGSLYCARSTTVRKYRLPYGLLVEDGFVKAMVCTENFSKPADEGRVVRAPDAAHLFTPVKSVREAFRHEVRLAVGTELNISLFDHLRQAYASGIEVTNLIALENERDPQWVASLIADRKRNSQLRSHAFEYALKPLRGIRHLHARNKLAMLPVLSLRIVFNGAAALVANVTLRRGRWAW
jgi:hypothetical protein